MNKNNDENVSDEEINRSSMFNIYNKPVEDINDSDNSSTPAPSKIGPTDNNTLQTKWITKKVFEANVSRICPLCGKEFAKVWNWRQHIDSAHQLLSRDKLSLIFIKSDTAKCNECNQIIKSSKFTPFLTHSITHMPNKKYFKCKHCDWYTSTSIVLRNHLLKKHPQINVEGRKISGYRQCPYCLQKFTTVIKMSGHMRNFHKNLIDDKTIFNCPLCNTEFSTYKRFRKHFPKRHQLTCATDYNFEKSSTLNAFGNIQCIYKCKECRVTKPDSKVILFQLQTHFLKHTNQPCYKCKYCGKLSLGLKASRNHLCTKVRKALMQNIVSKKYLSKKLRETSKKKDSINEKNTNADPLQDASHDIFFTSGLRIGVCPERAVVLNQFREYITFACPECNESIETQDLWNVHINRNHTFFDEDNIDISLTDSGIRQCTICQTKIPENTRAAQRHKLTHMPYKSYICKLCQHRSSTFSVLIQHLRRKHFTEGIYKCPLCPKALNMDVDLHEHVRKEHTISELPNTTCTICLHTAKDIWSLSKHIKIHDINREVFSCEECDCKYYKRFDLRQHKAKYHSSKPTNKNAVAGTKHISGEEANTNIVLSEPVEPDKVALFTFLEVGKEIESNQNDNSQSVSDKELFDKLTTYEFNNLDDSSHWSGKIVFNDDQQERKLCTKLDLQHRNELSETHSADNNVASKNNITGVSNKFCVPIESVVEEPIEFSQCDDLDNFNNEEIFEATSTNLNNSNENCNIETNENNTLPNKWLTRKVFEANVSRICPICAVEFVKFLNWRQHIDDVHQLLSRDNLNLIFIGSDMAKCNECDQTIKSTKFTPFLTHAITHMPNDKYFKCKHCDWYTSTSIVLRNHLLKKHPQINAETGKVSEYKQCPYCLQQFNTIFQMREHMRNIHKKYIDDKTIFICPPCKAEFLTYKQFRKHFHKTHKAAGATDYKFEKFSSLNKAGNTSYAYQCKVCTVTMMDSKMILFQLQTHFFKHANQHCFKCKYCKKFFFGLKTSRNHVCAKVREALMPKAVSKAYLLGELPQVSGRKKHTSKTKDTKADPLQVTSDDIYYTSGLRIGVCPERSVVLNQFSKYITFACPECNEGIETQYQWNLHINSNHTFFDGDNIEISIINGVRQCTICQTKIPENTRAAQRHKLTHMPYKSYICKLCQQRSNTFSVLIQHMRRKHFTQGKYQCPLCPKVLNLDVDRHEHVHKEHKLSELPKTTCTICLHTAKDIWSFGKHIKIHDPNREVFSCDKCECKYYKRFDLRRHIAKYH